MKSKRVRKAYLAGFARGIDVARMIAIWLEHAEPADVARWAEAAIGKVTERAKRKAEKL